MGGATKGWGLNPQSIVRGAADVMTLGQNEVFGNPVGKMAGSVFGNPSAPRLAAGATGQNPAEVLGSTGGAPLLANIAMGANIDDALAGYLNVPKAEYLDALNGGNSNINPRDLQLIQSVRDQLNSVQSDRNLRQQAVDKVVNDFPNIVQSNMKMYGDQYDDNMKQYVDQALQGTAAKFAAGGALSSGAANEAFARVGAENANNRLNYMSTNATRDASLRLNEVNSLRDFQNTMLGQVVPQGFSATQANLQRQFAGQQQQNELANQQNLSNQQSSNALFGSLGSLAGTAVGAYFGGPMGAAAGSQLGSSLGSTVSGQSGRMANPSLNLNSPSSDSMYPSMMRRY